MRNKLDDQTMFVSDIKNTMTLRNTPRHNNISLESWLEGKGGTGEVALTLDNTSE